MSLDNKPTYTGGCQCGAVRFRVEGALSGISICHCRMCQKAFGSFYAPLAGVPKRGLAWTRGEPKRFRSSDHVRRGFCAECGTPLTFEAPDGVALAIGAFDDPGEVAPTVQWGIGGEAALCRRALRPAGTPHGRGPRSPLPICAELRSFQHPDHDTDIWPPEAHADR